MVSSILMSPTCLHSNIMGNEMINKVSKFIVNIF